MAATAVPASNRLRVRLLLGTMAPTAGVLLVFGFLAHEVARRALETELGRRLQTAAAGAAATVLPEQLRALRPGDEGSLTYANVGRRLEAARARLGVRRVVAVTPDLEARGDTAGLLPLGAHAYELDADRAEIGRALAGAPASSPLFVGHDGLSYERAYAAVGDPGDVAGLIAVEGDAEYPAALAAFRRSMLLAGLAAAAGVLIVTLWLARRISGPVTRLAEAAARLGRGDLEAPFPIETRDEIGVLARTFEETRQALRARDERTQMMLAGIAHEVRNPLGGLELYAGLLREALVDQRNRVDGAGLRPAESSPEVQGGHGWGPTRAYLSERLEEVRRIEREVGHLKTVVNDFLEFARRAAPRLEAVELQPLCREVAELARAGSEAQVVLEVPAALRVLADAGQLRRVLLNLTRNAVVASKSGRIEVGAQPEGRRVRVTVRDDGPGVPPELREKIFTPFFTTREKGTGLGLAFVREIVRDHGGEVGVRDADGGGSVFTFDVPLAEEAGPT